MPCGRFPSYLGISACRGVCTSSCRGYSTLVRTVIPRWRMLLAPWFYLCHIVWCEPFWLPVPSASLSHSVYLLRQSISRFFPGGVLSLIFEFLITSPGSLWKLTATWLPADFYIRERGEWIIKGSHLEIMKRNKMPMLIAQGAVGITGMCYCCFFKHYCRTWNVICWESDTQGQYPWVIRVTKINKLFPQNSCDMIITFIVNHSWMNTQIQIPKAIQQAEWHIEFFSSPFHFLYFFLNGSKPFARPVSKGLNTNTEGCYKT